MKKVCVFVFALLFALLAACGSYTPPNSLADFSDAQYFLQDRVTVSKAMHLRDLNEHPDFPGQYDLPSPLTFANAEFTRYFMFSAFPAKEDDRLTALGYYYATETEGSSIHAVAAEAKALLIENFGNPTDAPHLPDLLRLEDAGETSQWNVTEWWTVDETHVIVLYAMQNETFGLVRVSYGLGNYDARQGDDPLENLDPETYTPIIPGQSGKE